MPRLKPSYIHMKSRPWYLMKAPNPGRLGIHVMPQLIILLWSNVLLLLKAMPQVIVLFLLVVFRPYDPHRRLDKLIGLLELLSLLETFRLLDDLCIVSSTYRLPKTPLHMLNDLFCVVNKLLPMFSKLDFLFNNLPLIVPNNHRRPLHSFVRAVITRVWSLEDLFCAFDDLHHVLDNPLHLSDNHPSLLRTLLSQLIIPLG